MSFRKRTESEVARNTMWSLAEEGSVLVTALIATVFLTPTLGGVGYGDYASMFALIGPFTAFAQSGVTLSILEHSVGLDENPTVLARSCMSIVMCISAIVAPIGIILMMLCVPRIDTGTVVLFMLGEVVVQSVWCNIGALVQSLYGYRQGVFLRFLSQFSRASIVIGLSLSDRLTLATLAVVNLVVFAGFSVIAIVIAARSSLGLILPGRIVRSHASSTAKYGTGISASIAHNTGDNFILNWKGPVGETGLYAAGQRLVSMAMIPLIALTASTHFAVLRSIRDTSDQRTKALRFSIVGLIYAIPMMFLVILLAPLAPVVLRSHEFDGTTDVIRLLAPVIILRGLGGFPMNGLLGLGRNKLRTTLLVSNAIVAISLYMLLIPNHSWHGAIVATLISETYSLTASWIALVLAQRRADRDAVSADDDLAAQSEMNDAVIEISDIVALTQETI